VGILYVSLSRRTSSRKRGFPWAAPSIKGREVVPSGMCCCDVRCPCHLRLCKYFTSRFRRFTTYGEPSLFHTGLKDSAKRCQMRRKLFQKTEQGRLTLLPDTRHICMSALDEKGKHTNIPPFVSTIRGAGKHRFRRAKVGQCTPPNGRRV